MANEDYPEYHKNNDHQNKTLLPVGISIPPELTGRLSLADRCRLITDERFVL